MLRTGILNPDINSLLSRVRHTNTLVIADRGFPYWPEIETVDISLVDDVPKVLTVLRAVLANFVAGRIYVAEEFRAFNTAETWQELVDAAGKSTLVVEAHEQLKKRVPEAIGLIRTGETTQYANLIVESA